MRISDLIATALHRLMHAIDPPRQDTVTARQARSQWLRSLPREAKAAALRRWSERGKTGRE